MWAGLLLIGAVLREGTSHIQSQLLLSLSHCQWHAVDQMGGDPAAVPATQSTLAGLSASIAPAPEAACLFACQ